MGKSDSELKQGVRIQDTGQIRTLSFAHPKGNCLPTDLSSELEKAIKSTPKSCSIICLQSIGETVFCAGASFQELSKLKSDSAAAEFFMGIARVLLALYSAPQLTVSKVQGKAVGGGVGLIAATDYCIASETAAVMLSELELGLGPYVIAPFVERKIGLANFSALAIDGQWRDSQWCKSTGLFSEVVPAISLDKEVEKLCSRLSSSSREAIETLKTSLWEQSKDLENELMARAKLSGSLTMKESTQANIQSKIKK